MGQADTVEAGPPEGGTEIENLRVQVGNDKSLDLGQMKVKFRVAIDEIAAEK